MPEERKTEVKTLMVELFCECNNKMEPTGECLTSHPPQYPHLCISCGKTINIIGKKYPCIEYEEL